MFDLPPDFKADVGKSVPGPIPVKLEHHDGYPLLDDLALRREAYGGVIEREMVPQPDRGAKYRPLSLLAKKRESVAVQSKLLG